MSGQAPPLRERHIPCGDRAGRPRAIRIMAIKDRIVVIAPPGEVAVLSRANIRRLRAALGDAAAELTSQLSPGPDAGHAR